MMFKSGEDAVLFYVKARAMGFVCAGSEFIMEDEGYGLQYDSNTLPGAPAYTTIVETLVDLEKILKASLSHLEIQFILAWAGNVSIGDDEFPENPTFDEFQAMTKRGQSYRILQILTKVEGGLRQFKYLHQEAAETFLDRRFNNPRRAYKRPLSAM
jgi:hypothetical protein